MTKATCSEITALSDQAIEWLVLLSSGNATEQDRLQAEAWLNRSPAHRQAFTEAKLLVADMDAAMMVSSAFSENSDISLRHSLYGLTILAAACLIFALVLPFAALVDRWSSDYHTQVGEQKTITLADGSLVVLNTDTALALEYSATVRRVRLLRGQAEFHVAANATRPFEVATAIAVVKALGTQFEVWTLPDAARITVQQHAVSVKGINDPDYPETAQIKAGQQAIFNANQGLQASIRVDVLQTTAWQRGKLIFNSRPIAEVVAELNRYLPGRILIVDPKLANLVVSGVFPSNDPRLALTMLEQTLAIGATSITPLLTLLHR